MEGLVDLHRHLDGSLRLSTLSEFARDDGVRVPEALSFFPGMGLEQALARFAFTLARLNSPDRVARVAHEICEDAERDGVSTLEIRFGPQLHEGAPPAHYIDAALEGVNGRAGLILCALYGDSPALIDDLVALSQSRPGVVGIDLAGGPLPSHHWTLADYGPAFQRAREQGLGTTVHAGEGRSADEIRTAIEVLGARRIGHGTTLLDAPGLVDLIREREICIEACVTSNWHVGATIELDTHPRPQWLDLEIDVCICTDNVLLSSVDASEEYRRAARLPGMSPRLLERALEAGHRSRFIR
jgi:adenosine deaminase